MSSYQVYVVRVNFLLIYRLLSCATFVLVYGMSVALPVVRYFQINKLHSINQSSLLFQ